jgi:hypothetical protein
MCVHACIAVHITHQAESNTALPSTEEPKFNTIVLSSVKSISVIVSSLSLLSYAETIIFFVHIPWVIVHALLAEPFR